MEQGEPFTIVSDCYDEVALAQLVSSVRLPEGSQLRTQEADNVAFLADPTVVASIVAGSALIISTLGPILIKELLAQHQRNCDKKVDAQDGCTGDAEQRKHPQEQILVPAVIVTYHSGPCHVIASLDRVPGPAHISERGISEIRLVFVEPRQAR